MLPRDPAMLLSVVNTLLRDKYPSLEELVAAEGIDKTQLTDTLAELDYNYDRDVNQFT